MIQRLSLGPRSQVVEIGSNDGYLLQYFKQAGIGVLGVEPSSNVATVAGKRHGIESVVDFFGTSVADLLVARGTTADLIVANNVLAHVPAINDFIAGFRRLLKPDGIITFEFPHLLRMVEQCQFDTIYHEHYYYLSLRVVERFLESHGLQVYDVEELDTHGGSLRVYASHQGRSHDDPIMQRRRHAVYRAEADFGLESVATFADFGRDVVVRKTDFLSFLIDARAEGKTVLGYGAPAKGNTFLNFCGVGAELLAYTVDLNPYKQGKFLPGVNIPVRTPADLMRDRPDYVVILPWNLSAEISAQLSGIQKWGGRFVVAIPKLEIFP
jgi:SAM-dependent methyltransferase